MPSFEYQSLAADGQIRSGTLAADDRADVVRQLLNRGETATRVVPVGAKRTITKSASSSSRGSASRLGLRARSRPTINRAEMATFIREIATAVEAGLPLLSALQVIQRQARGRAMPVIVAHLIERVEAGDPLWSAARDYGRPFDDLIVGMLRAADASGEMNTILHQLADLLERSVELRREVSGATFYPAIVLVLLLVSAVVLVTVLVPKLIAPIAAEAAFTMPLPTRILLGLADFIGAWWFVIAAIVALSVGGWAAWIRQPANRLRFDYFKLKIPVFGRLVRDVAVARFTRTLGTLAASGMPLLDALRITRGTLGNAALSHAIESVEGDVTSGKSLADPLDRTGLFPPMLIQVVSLGERSGRLDQMLLHAATAFDRQVQVSIKLFTKALPPFLLVIMALLGGFVLLAILLPMLELQSMIGG